MAKPKTGSATGSKSYTPKQIGIILDASKRKLGRRSILKEYPNEGFTLGGVAAVLRRLKKTGTAERQTRKRKVTARSKDKVSKVKDLAEKHHELSLKDIGSKVGLKKGTVYNVIKRDLKRKSVKKVKGQHLRDKKKRKRLDFAKKTMRLFEEGEIPWANIFVTDEKLFKPRGGKAQCAQNAHIWVDAKLKKADVDPDLLVMGKKAWAPQVMVCFGGVAPWSNPSFFRATRGWN